MDNNLKFSVHSTAQCYCFSKFDMLPTGMGQCSVTWNSLGHGEFAACLLHYYQYETYLVSAVLTIRQYMITIISAALCSVCYWEKLSFHQ